MKLYLLIFLIIAFSFSNLFAEDTKQDSSSVDLFDHFAIMLKYNNDLHSENRINIGGKLPLYKYYSIDAGFLNLTWLNKDYNNHQRRNFSLFPVIDWGLMFLISQTIPKEILEKNEYSTMFITNASHVLHITGRIDENNPTHLRGSLIFKNYTDLFLFQQKNWLQVSPGVGIKLISGPIEFDLGYERKFQFVEHRKIKTVDGYFFSIVLNIYDLE